MDNSKYNGFFGVQVQKKNLAPIILSALRNIYPLREERETADMIVLVPNPLLQYEEPESMILPLEELERAVKNELDARFEKKEDIAFPYFRLRLTLWEKEMRGHTDNREKSLEGFPNCYPEQICVARTCHVEKGIHDSDASGRGFIPHRAISVNTLFYYSQNMKGSPFTFKNSIFQLLSSEMLMDEVFGFFKHHYG